MYSFAHADNVALLAEREEEILEMVRRLERELKEKGDCKQWNGEGKKMKRKRYLARGPSLTDDLLLGPLLRVQCPPLLFITWSAGESIPRQ